MMVEKWVVESLRSSALYKLKICANHREKEENIRICTAYGQNGRGQLSVRCTGKTSGKTPGVLRRVSARRTLQWLIQEREESRRNRLSRSPGEPSRSLFFLRGYDPMVVPLVLVPPARSQHSSRFPRT
ncbi:hypothetical protein TNCV_2322241 [Trichonephila clavipes]|nr:hypothetical protein TNCV_2322241 [Trichonephila clavipes]